MAADNESAGLASSFTDLMTSLAIIFILLLVATFNNAHQEVEDFKSQILSRLQKALQLFRDQGVEVKTDPKDPLGLLVLIPEDLLRFQQGRSEIPQKGHEFLVGFTPKLVSTACSPELRAGIKSIVVEGHASSEGNENDNLHLSQKRSMEVVKEGLAILSDLEKSVEPVLGLRSCFLDFVSATGRGSAEPIKNPLGQEDREQSRRVVFKIRVQSLEQLQFEKQVTLPSSPKTIEQ